mmetsp:Transcript_11354/g.17039  ORF Transcript_11354/g.17039 Transcript_11354/m.17039 type:complete len:98 (+) Transcript_11354:473-766(+)
MEIKHMQHSNQKTAVIQNQSELEKDIPLKIHRDGHLLLLLSRLWRKRRFHTSLSCLVFQIHSIDFIKSRGNTLYYRGGNTTLHNNLESNEVNEERTT